MSEVFGGKMVFPIHNTGHGEPFDEGMSLRVYCAIQAMHGMLASGNLPKSVTDKELAQAAYDVADAMLEAT
jgi:hypothetical protein